MSCLQKHFGPLPRYRGQPPSDHGSFRRGVCGGGAFLLLTTNQRTKGKNQIITKLIRRIFDVLKGKSKSEKPLTSAELAERLQVTTRTLQSMARTGRIPVLRITNANNQSKNERKEYE